MFSILALQNGIAPPTINLEDPDPECDLDYVANVARRAHIRYVTTSSLGFGGHNASFVFGPALAGRPRSKPRLGRIRRGRSKKPAAG